MTRPFALLAIRLLALYFMGQFFNGLPLIYLSISPEASEALPRFHTLVYVFSPFVVGFALWFCAPRLAGTCSVESAEGHRVTEHDLVSVGCFLMGCYLSVVQLGHILGWLQSAQETGRSFWGVVNWGNLFVLAVAVCMICGGRFFVAAYYRLKHFRTGTLVRCDP